MKRMTIFSFAVAAAIPFAGPALAAASTTSTCLSPRLVSGWTTTEAKNVIMVRLAGGKRFRLELAGQWPGLNTILALRVGIHGSGVCVDKGDYISYRYHEFGEERCLIRSVTPVQLEDENQGEESAD